jgi:tripartite ATP-independent transporter DctM subunit
MIIVLLFTLMFVLMALGLPIALSIGLPAIGLIVAPGVFPDTVTLAALGQTVVQQLFSGVDSFDLLAVPLFMIAGSIMEVGGISRRLIDFCDSLVGWAPGGLAAAAIVASMIIAGISGSAAADTAAIGAVVIPAMIRQGYPPAFAAAVVAAGGSIGIIIPPSIPMVIYGFMTNISTSQLFAGGMLVGVLLGVSFLAVAVFISWRKGYGERQPFTWKKVAVTGKAAIWSMGAPVVVLGGILSGIVTVTEAAALAVFYALLVGTVINRELAWKDLPGLIVRSQVAAGGILFIIAMAKIFGWLLAMQQGGQLLSDFIATLSLPPTGLLLLIMAMLLVIGCVMETTAALLLLVPVLALLTTQMQIDPVQFGVLVVANLAIGMLTPPVGICLFVSCSVAGVPLGKISRSVMPLVIIALVDLLIASVWPPLTMWLPTLFYR